MNTYKFIVNTLSKRVRKDYQRTIQSVGVSEDIIQVQAAVKLHNKSESPRDNEKKKGKTKNASPQKQAKPKL